MLARTDQHRTQLTEPRVPGARCGGACLKGDADTEVKAWCLCSNGPRGGTASPPRRAQRKRERRRQAPGRPSSLKKRVIRGAAAFVLTPSSARATSGDRLLDPLTECKQVAVDEVGMRGGQAVGQARVVDLPGSLDQPCRLLR